jgi:polyhydroxyalkanoate synthase subunit PhaC
MVAQCHDRRPRRLGAPRTGRRVRNAATARPDTRINALGYCLGGTLLTIAAAYLARERDPILNSVTLLAAQTDFTEAGELMLFIDDSQLSYLEDLMRDQGYRDTRRMAGAFQLLRSNDLIWSRAQRVSAPAVPRQRSVRRALWGRRQADRIERHSRPDVRRFDRNHVAPWRSVYKRNLVDDTDVTFVLTSGGHNAGIVSEPGHKGRHYRIANRAAGAQ